MIGLMNLMSGVARNVLGNVFSGGGVTIRPQRSGILGGLLSKLPSIGGFAQGVIDWRNQKMINERQNRYNMEMSKFTFDKQLEMWNRQNEYNLPVNQMQRFKDAGLNPNLIYSQGTPGQATQLPQYQKPEGQFQNRSILQILPMLSFAQDYRQKEQSISNMRSVQLNQEADTLLKSINYDYLNRAFNFRLNKEMYQSKSSAYQSDMMAIQARMLYQKIMSEINSNIARTNLSVSQKGFVDIQKDTYNIIKGAGTGAQVLNALLNAIRR